MSDTFPVSINGHRVGSATKTADGFNVVLGDVKIGSEPVKSAPRPAPTGELPTTFPNYGRSKGAPIVGASAQDLDYYANGARKSLNDPAKARWHGKESALLAAIEAEQARQAGGGSSEEPPPHGDEDIPF
ncbi:MAG: hypothetical protein ACK4N5_05905 [Myxococcales bacterium]